MIFFNWKSSKIDYFYKCYFNNLEKLTIPFEWTDLNVYLHNNIQIMFYNNKCIILLIF